MFLVAAVSETAASQTVKLLAVGRSTTRTLACLRHHHHQPPPRRTVVMTTQEKQKSSNKKPKMRRMQTAFTISGDAHQQSCPPSFINMAVILSGSPGMSDARSLMLTATNSKGSSSYVFNCGEGFGRHVQMSKSLKAEANMTMRKITAFFITYKSWENTGGLLGTGMSMEEANIQKKKDESSKKSEPLRASRDMLLHGPKGIENVPHMARKFGEGSKNLSIERVDTEFKDENFTITPVPLRDPTTPTSPTHTRVNTRGRGSDSSSSSDGEPAAKKSKFSKPPEPDTAYAYIGSSPPPQPPINFEKCLDLGLKGPIIGELKNGNTVTLEDGREVTPDMVTDRVATDSRPFLVVDCPNKNFLMPLKTNDRLNEFRSTSDLEKSFCIVVHMTPADVFVTDEYQAWMKGFGPWSHHLVMNEFSGGADPLVIREHQLRLHTVDPGLFPLLVEVDRGGNDGLISAIADSAKRAKESDLLEGFPSEGAEGGGGDGVGKEVSYPPGRIVKAYPDLIYCLRSPAASRTLQGFQPEVDEYKPGDIEETLRRDPYIQTQLAALRQAFPVKEESGNPVSDEDTDTEEKSSSYPKIVFLGTGSAEASRIRAQSCIVLQLSKHTAAILDCGEDSWGQIFRFYGPKKANQLMRKVKAIFVSHMHADHYIGLFTLLRKRKEAFDERDLPFTCAFVMAPIQITRWLMFYHRQMKPINHLYRLVCHQDRVEEMTSSIQSASRDDLLHDLDLSHYLPVPVLHCSNAYGLTLTHRNGAKVTYSGDTRPCRQLIDAGKHSSVLIHEATHEDSLSPLARQHRHSTFSEAVRVGSEMEARHVILTHFSQRYPYIPNLEGMELPGNTGLAFDNMKVSPASLPRLSKVVPALRAMFQEKEQRMVARTQHMERRDRRRREILDSVIGDMSKQQKSGHEEKGKNKKKDNSNTSRSVLEKQQQEPQKSPQSMTKTDS